MATFHATVPVMYNEQVIVETKKLTEDIMEVFVETPFNFSLIHPKADIKIFAQDQTKLLFTPCDFVLRLYFADGYMDIGYKLSEDAFEVLENYIESNVEDSSEIDEQFDGGEES